MKILALGLLTLGVFICWVLWISAGECNVDPLNCEGLPRNYYYSCVQARESVRIRELLEDY